MAIAFFLLLVIKKTLYQSTFNIHTQIFALLHQIEKGYSYSYLILAKKIAAKIIKPNRNKGTNKLIGFIIFKS
jgi:hypothetical protein